MEHEARAAAAEPPAGASRAFGAALPAACRFVQLLAGAGVERGVIGPDEVGRLWERHVLNSVALAELVATGSRVLDVGSGAGLPGIPLALARGDLRVELLEPRARRVRWLRETVDRLELPVRVHHERAEGVVSDDERDAWDVVTARAVAPLGRLARLCLPLVTVGGDVLAMKGERARDELARDGQAVRDAGGTRMEVVECGIGFVVPPATVVLLGRGEGPPRARPSTASGRRGASVSRRGR